MNAQPQTDSSTRRVLRTVRGHPTSDGAGVKLTRLIGTPELPRLDPFLMLDEFGSDRPGDYLAGFPPHPHRGFETVTYMLAGRMRHRDNHGNEGLLVPGAVQWMTAGRGIVHSEMPEQEQGLMRGFQLWVNLPARDKMTEPRYQELGPELIPEAQPAPGVHAKVIAGHVGELAGPINGIATDPTYLDLTLEPGARLEHALASTHAAFVYAFEGTLRIGEAILPAGTLAVLGEGGRVVLEAGPERVRALLVAGAPLREPVVQHGPFVMNTRDEIEQAIRDYQSGRF